jgi:hypothetical protein
VCVHHYAPLNGFIETSWGDRLRLKPTADGRQAVAFDQVAPGPALWLFFVDINLCTTDGPEPRPLTGVAVNGVALSAVVMVDGLPALGFALSADGRVVP